MDELYCRECCEVYYNEDEFDNHVCFNSEWRDDKAEIVRLNELLAAARRMPDISPMEHLRKGFKGIQAGMDRFEELRKDAVKLAEIVVELHKVGGVRVDQKSFAERIIGEWHDD